MARPDLRGLLDRATAAGVTPGGVLQVGDAGAPVLCMPFGTTQSDPPGEGSPVREETVYDVASLTKPVVTTALLMKLAGSGELDLDEPVGDRLPLGGDAARVTARQLAGHASGYPAHIKFYERILAGDLRPGESRREALVRMAAETALEAAPGTRALYSDLGFILLGALLERLTGARLDELAQRLVTGPLSMTASRFVDLLAERPYRFPPGAVAPTERCPRRGLVRGEVHDDNAHAGGGIFGHAGLFSTAPDLGRFAVAMCAAASGARDSFAPEIVSHFFRSAAAPGTCHRLGWESPSREPGASHAGDRWPRDGVGHLGFTGCSLWLDPPRGRWAVLLTNRVHPSRDGTGIKELRRAVMDAVVADLG